MLDKKKILHFANFEFLKPGLLTSLIKCLVVPAPGVCVRDALQGSGQFDSFIRAGTYNTLGGEERYGKGHKLLDCLKQRN